MGWQPIPDGDRKYSVSVYNSVASDTYVFVPPQFTHRAQFHNVYGDPTDVDAVWRDRETHYAQVQKARDAL